MRPSGTHNTVDCRARNGMQYTRKAVVSRRASSDEVVQDGAFSAIGSKCDPQNTKANTAVSEAAGNTALPASPVRGNPRPTKFLSTPKQK